MKQHIDIEGYWGITVYYNIPLKDGVKGFTYTEAEKRRSIVCIGELETRADFLNTIVHEAKHVQSQICAYYNVPEDGEQAAYLIGYIVEKMYSGFKQYL